MCPVDWSEHRQPKMYFGGRGIWTWRLCLVPIIVLLVVLGRTGTSYEVVSVLGSALIASVAAFLVELRYRKRDKALRFGRLGTGIMLTVIWCAVFGAQLFFFLLYTPSGQP